MASKAVSALGKAGANATANAQTENSRCSVSSGGVAGRRGMLAGSAGLALLAGKARTADAAYGDRPKVFGQPTNTSGFFTYDNGDYSFLVPSKFNPSAERPYAGIDVRYEDNFDAVNTVTVIKQPTSKKSIEEFGSVDSYVNSLQYLLGQQAIAFNSISEGGFPSGSSGIANVFDAKEEYRNGRPYYVYEILTTTNDGNEGGRHHLIATTVANGYLYTYRFQVGDKRWYKGYDKYARQSAESFQVA